MITWFYSSRPKPNREHALSTRRGTALGRAAIRRCMTRPNAKRSASATPPGTRSGARGRPSQPSRASRSHVVGRRLQKASPAPGTATTASGRRRTAATTTLPLCARRPRPSTSSVASASTKGGAEAAAVPLRSHRCGCGGQRGAGALRHSPPSQAF